MVRNKFPHKRGFRSMDANVRFIFESTLFVCVKSV
ncbi:hypothetical protein EVA_22427 [gut metagenome]|uniref:Uncharacterized protein n=1 Tax=gut metagenome TaxID=749906 RepID=J9FPZ6_9ZZZZ